MTRRYVNLSLVYALLGMAAGVFYREYTKFSGFAGQTSLGFMHAHYLVLGMAMFLLLALLEKALVAVVPCSGFGAKNFVRWSYAASMENIEKGLDRLEKFISK